MLFTMLSVSYQPTSLTLAHHGGKAYGETFELIHRREADRPNAIWQADHTLLDILLIRDGGPPQRPWLTVVLDDYSRAVAGYFLTFEAPSAIQTAVALRQAIWRKDDPRWNICGIPEVLYTDIAPGFYIFDGGLRFNGDTIMAFIKAQHAAGKHYEWNVTEPDVHISDDTAWIAYVNKGSITDASGTTQLKWLESAFLQKQAGNWKIVFMHSTRVPPKQTENRGQ
jgi:hypothetical protein